MRNAETPVRKFALYGAHSSLADALLSELLGRQHEAVAVVADLDAVDLRPGLRAKLGDPYEASSVGESAAGMDAAILFASAAPRLAAGSARQGDLLSALQALESGLSKAKVRRLLLIVGPAELDDACREQLLGSSLDWTLATAPEIPGAFTLDDFRRTDQRDASAPLQLLGRIAAGLVDELENPRHPRQVMNFVF
jgi:putative NADH-flavin reductase